MVDVANLLHVLMTCDRPVMGLLYLHLYISEINCDPYNKLFIPSGYIQYLSFYSYYNHIVITLVLY